MPNKVPPDSSYELESTLLPSVIRWCANCEENHVHDWLLTKSFTVTVCSHCGWWHDEEHDWYDQLLENR